jgi:hypothetical protein
VLDNALIAFGNNLSGSVDKIRNTPLKSSCSQFNDYYCFFLTQEFFRPTATSSTTVGIASLVIT